MRSSTRAIQSLIDEGVAILAPSCEDARLSAEILLARLLKMERTALLSKSDEIVSEKASKQYFDWIERRKQHEPVAYIVGEKEFYSLPFEVTSATLIPRPETESVVEEALALLKKNETPKICDVGTGSGAIAIAIKHALPSSVVTATDQSVEALTVAKRNAQRNNAEIHFLESDLLEHVEGKFHLIAANLPYIPTADLSSLAPDVLQYEPKSALDGGPDGLTVISKLVQSSTNHLEPGGIILLEIGMGQKDAVVNLLESAGFKILNVRNDFQKIPRVIAGILG